MCLNGYPGFESLPLRQNFCKLVIYMEKGKLFVFAGRPGAGKTTIIKKLFFEEIIVDVLPFVEVFRVEGKVIEEKTIVAYQNMYGYLVGLKKPKVILEIGTNHPELNISELEKLQNDYEIKIFLCEASEESCYQRAIQRGMRHDPQAFETRMKRDFPNIFIKLLKQTSLSYEVVGMDKSLEDTIALFNQLVGI